MPMILLEWGSCCLTIWSCYWHRMGSSLIRKPSMKSWPSLILKKQEESVLASLWKLWIPNPILISPKSKLLLSSKNMIGPTKDILISMIWEKSTDISNKILMTRPWSSCWKSLIQIEMAKSVLKIFIMLWSRPIIDAMWHVFDSMVFWCKWKYCFYGSTIFQ